MKRLPILFIMLALLGAYGCGNKQQQSQNMVADSTHADSMPVKDTTTVDTVPVADTIKALPPDTNAIYRDTVVCDSLTTIGMMEWGDIRSKEIISQAKRLQRKLYAATKEDSALNQALQYEATTWRTMTQAFDKFQCKHG